LLRAIAAEAPDVYVFAAGDAKAPATEKAVVAWMRRAAVAAGHRGDPSKLTFPSTAA
jgi:hypothetical protein